LALLWLGHLLYKCLPIAYCPRTSTRKPCDTHETEQKLNFSDTASVLSEDNLLSKKALKVN